MVYNKVYIKMNTVNGDVSKVATYVKKAGIKECFVLLLVVAGLSTMSSYVGYVLPSYKVLGHILGVVLIGIYGVFVLKRYCAVVTYELRDDGLLVRHELGRHTNEELIKYKHIKSITNTRPECKDLKIYTVRILPRKADLYIVSKNAAVRITDDDGNIKNQLLCKTKGK